MHLRFEVRTLGLIAVTPLAIATLLIFVLLPDTFARSQDRREEAGAPRPRRSTDGASGTGARACSMAAEAG